MTTPILDFETLMAPIPGEQPAGVRLPPDVRKKMDDARKEFEPNPDDPSQPPIPKKPDWQAIIKLATDALSKTSKDLETAARLTEALAKRHEFAGLRDGLKLMRLLLTEAWDRIHPIIDDPEDLEYCAGPVVWITDPESGAWFPASLKKLPLLKVKGQFASYDDCENGKLADQPLTGDDIKAGQMARPTIPEEVAESLSELEAIDQTLAAKMGDQTPNLSGLREVLTGCQRFLGHLSSANSTAAAEDSSGQAGEETAAVTATRPTGATNRAETYRQLAQLADNLALLEPHSPIPDLLRWAVKLGRMPFRELIQELVREPNVLAEIRRQFGIHEAENSGAATS